jgi:hypothetical protein
VADTKVVVQGPTIGLGTLLFCIFLVLKLLGKITWSWWWVTSPLWIPFGLFFAFIAFCLCMAALAAAFGK